MIDILLLPMLAGLLLAIAAGPLGCFVIWNRMAYFGDTLAHSALFGVSLALFSELPIHLGMFFSCFLIACGLLLFREDGVLPRDTLLGIFSHGSLAAGVILVGVIEGVRVDLLAFLFGDILAISVQDVLLIGFLSGLVLLAIWLSWKPLLLNSIDPELAKVEGINTNFYRALLMFLLAGLIALSIKIVGVLLIGAMLIIPAASARNGARSPGMMALGASVFGVSAVIGGMFLSWFSDAPAGPSIVLFSFLIFILSTVLFSVKKINPSQ